ncbi:MAG: sigma-70 family RNA polymerase sigma factor [Bacilli bacterium]|nr:sigma-70 family RNA polymerase sigma factor [Bacilli bacterium]
MDYKGYNDYEVLYMISENDECATSIIYQKYKPIILSIANIHKNEASNLGIDYDDLVQEGMYGLSKAIKTYDSNNTLFYTYAVICIKGHIKNLIRTCLTKKQSILNNSISLSYSIDEGRELEEEIADNRDYSTTKAIKYLEEKELIKNFMYDLKDKEREIFELKLNGFSNKEITELLTYERKKVDNIVFKLKTKFSLFLTNY